MSQYVRALRELDASLTGLVGGKAANLGELLRIPGVRVPAGWCVTTDAPGDLRAEIAAVIAPGTAHAVRSSATAEDSPNLSFAGQHDTFLNVVGVDPIVAAVARCRASLDSDRAASYRAQHGFDQPVRIAVVIQEMVQADAAGVLFTADPLSGNRRVASIEAVHGLGDALVSGRVTPDAYRVRDGAILDKRGSVLTDDQVLRLAQLGRLIEAHFGRPQDIEWCLAGDAFSIVQSRPITTLFPIPAPRDDAFHVYVSIGHNQMMTDAMKPLGLSMFQMFAMAPMFAAGGRLFVDVTRGLMSPGRENLLNVMGNDPLMRDALEQVLARGELGTSDDPVAGTRVRSHKGMSVDEIAAADPASVPVLVAERERSLAVLEAEIAQLHGVAVFDFIVEDIARAKALLADPRILTAVMAGINASGWLNEQFEAWLGEKNVADVIARTLPTNITSEMGSALLELADAIRPHPDLVARLRAGELDGVPLADFLAKYGMRCAGEIDITRERWAENPRTLVPLLLSSIDQGHRTFDERRREALASEAALLARVPAADRADAERMIAVVRAFMGFREYPKYHLVSRLFVWKQAMLRETAALGEDIFYLTFAELHEAVRTGIVDRELIARRRAEHAVFEKLAPPRVITSDGEVFIGAYRRTGIPEGALAGLAVSSGVIEGRARVVLAIEDAHLVDGDILVTRFTDPSWTPAFVSIKGLVTEVGGLMTHGAVIAREYALPAVVGVEDATRRIRDGQRIRLNGTDGYVELL